MLALILSVIMNIEADFVQIKQSQMLNKPQQTQGHFVYRAPKYLRWEYTQPEKMVWEIDDEKTNANPQVKRLLELIIKSISGDYLTTNDDFDVLQNENIYTLTPKKREIKNFFTSMQITLDEQTKLASEVIMNEKNNDKTTIIFKYVER